jgi:hypothetical protein
MYDPNLLDQILVNILLLLSSGDNEIARVVIDESNAVGEEARKFLEEVRRTYPQVCIYKVLLFIDSAIM